SGDGVSEAHAFAPVYFEHAPSFFCLRAISGTQYHAGDFQGLPEKRSNRQGSVMKLRGRLPVMITLLTIGLLSAIPGETKKGWWQWQNPRPQGNPLYAVAFSDERRGLAVGRDGTILRTDDGGQKWLSARTTVNTPLYGLAVKGKKAWAVGARGVVLFSDDRGENWREQNSVVKKHLYAVCFVNEKQGWAVGVEGLILTTDDGGETWREQRSGANKHLNAVAFADDKHGVAAGAEGLVLVTNNGGLVWQSKPEISNYNLLGASAVGPSTFRLVGSNGAILRSPDA